MKSYLLPPALAFALGVLSHAALAYSGLGIGVVNGDTHGITIKIPAIGASAVNAAAGVDFFAAGARLRVNWQPLVISGNNSLAAPLHVSLGGFIEPTGLGVCAPQWQRAPFEIFAQTSLEASLTDNNHRAPGFGISGAISVRLDGR